MSCLVCNNKAGVSLRNGVNVFGDLTTLQSGKKLVDVLNEIVERPVKEDEAHSKILCKKCYKTCTEYDSIQVRLKVIQTSMLSQFKNTLQSHNLTYQPEIKEANKDVAICTEKKFEGKRIVLPASKLQPLPPDYLLRAGKWQTVRPTATIASKINNQEIKILTPSTLNLKVTVGTSVLTQSIKTTSSLTGKPQRTTSHISSAPQTVSIVTSSVMTAATAPSLMSSVSTAPGAKVSNSVLSINMKDLQKNNFTSAILTKVLERASDLETFRQAGSDVGSDAGNEEQSMEIEEDCSLAVLTASEDGSKIFSETTTKMDGDGDKTQSDGYFDMSLLSCPTGDDEDLEKKYILGKLEILDDNNDVEHTILMDSENGSIIRVVAGKKLLYGDSEISLMVPEEEDGDGENGDSQDSNDDGQIELQVSGDEETANAIIAAAQEQGGAFIKVDSGEMFQVKSVQSKMKNGAVAKNNTDVIITRVDGEYKCMICERNEEAKGAMFPDAADAAQHALSAHNARLHYCALCGELMRRKSDYIAHLDKHSNKAQIDKSKTHECTVCSKKYNSRHLLSEHMNVHSGERPYRCVVCGKTFASKYTHQSHLKTHLDRPRPFKCSQCGKTFLTQQNLTQHLKTHSGVKEFICKVCDKAFGTQHNLEVHGVVHTGSRPFVCGVCGKAFARRAEVRDHMRIHTGERPFSCEICGARFTQRSNLHSHRRATHLDDKRYKCQHCPKRFKRRRLLNYHVKASHTGERPLQCEVCRATFVYPEHYKKHLRIHSGEKPYVCEVCGRPFNTRDNLNTHRYVHSDKKPYECVVCGAGYMRKQLLYHHMNVNGHLAESIIVNQPRITKVPDVVTSSASLVMDSITGNSTLTDSIFETTETFTMESAEKSIDGNADCNAAKLFITDDKKIIIEEAGKSTINLVQGGEETPLITLHNIENVKDDSILDDVNTEQLVDETQITSGATDAAGVLRLVQVQLPDGRSGWLAVD